MKIKNFQEITTKNVSGDCKVCGKTIKATNRAQLEYNLSLHQEKCNKLQNARRLK